MHHHSSFMMMAILLGAAILALSPILLQSGYAATTIKQVQGFGDSVERFTCSNGQRPFSGSLINEVIQFDAIQTVEQGTSGQFQIVGIDANGAAKQGTITSIDINNGQFILTGTETSDNLCGDTIPSAVTISGDCKIQDRLPVAEIFFTAQNGQRGTFTGGVSCISAPTPAQGIQQLINDAQSIGVNTGPLHQAVELISDNNPNNDRAVCNQLDAFVNQVNRNLQQQQGQITPDQANQLISSAQQIKASIPACA